MNHEIYSGVPGDAGYEKVVPNDPRDLNFGERTPQQEEDFQRTQALRREAGRALAPQESEWRKQLELAQSSPDRAEQVEFIEHVLALIEDSRGESPKK